VVEEVEHVGEEWKEAGFKLSDFISTDQVFKLRFGATDNPNNSTTEAAVDALAFTMIDCGTEMLLSVDQAVGGQQTTMQVARATPGETVYFIASVAGAGKTNVPQLGVTLDLKQPMLVGQTTANGGGQATFQAMVPPGATGRILWLQAAETGRKSNAWFSLVN
jgi:hypothetical protein